MNINPALTSIAFLEGEWKVAISNAAFLPDPLASVEMPVAFEWIGDGAALMQRQGERPPTPPMATWIIGRDGDRQEFTVLYHDARGVARVYEMRFAEGLWRMWRDHPTFSQRFEGRVSEDQRRIDARWEKSTDQGRSWEHDFEMTYRR